MAATTFIPDIEESKGFSFFSGLHRTCLEWFHNNKERTNPAINYVLTMVIYICLPNRWLRHAPSDAETEAMCKTLIETVKPVLTAPENKANDLWDTLEQFINIHAKMSIPVQSQDPVHPSLPTEVEIKQEFEENFAKEMKARPYGRGNLDPESDSIYRQVLEDKDRFQLGRRKSLGVQLRDSYAPPSLRPLSEILEKKDTNEHNVADVATDTASAESASMVRRDENVPMADVMDADDLELEPDIGMKSPVAEMRGVCAEMGDAPNQSQEQQQQSDEQDEGTELEDEDEEQQDVAQQPQQMVNFVVPVPLEGEYRVRVVQPPNKRARWADPSSPIVLRKKIIVWPSMAEHIKK